VYEQNDAAPLRPEGRRGPAPALIIAILVAVLVLVFIVQNGHDARTEFLWMDFQLPLWILIAITLALGVALDRLFTMWWRRRRRAGRD
jgi:uncharacterized integral membrane protein